MTSGVVWQAAAGAGYLDPGAQWRAQQAQWNAQTRAEMTVAAQSANPERRVVAARHHLTPSDLLVALAHDPVTKVRRGLAANHYVPAQGARVLARCPEVDVRAALAYRRAALPDDVLLVLAQDTSRRVRRHVAEREVVRVDGDDWQALPLPQAVFDVLVVDPVVLVRRGLAKTQATSAARLMQLAGDANAGVRITAVKALATRGWDGEEAAGLVALARRAARDPDPEVRATAAGVPSLPVAVVSGLARDSSAVVRKVVAGHDALPIEDVARLVRDPSVAVRAVLARRAALGAEYLQVLLDDPAPSVRAAALRRPETTTVQIEAAAGDENATVRAVAARTGRLSGQALSRLVEDPVAGVREAATRVFLAVLGNSAL